MAAVRGAFSSFASQIGKAVLNSPGGEAHLAGKVCGGSRKEWWQLLTDCNAVRSSSVWPPALFDLHEAPSSDAAQDDGQHVSRQAGASEACWSVSSLLIAPPCSIQERYADDVSYRDIRSEYPWFHVGQGFPKVQPQVWHQSSWTTPPLPMFTLTSTLKTFPSPQPLLHTRHFSQGHRLVMGAKPKAAQGRALRLSAQSLNMVVEPYKKPKRLPLWERWLTLEGWRIRKNTVIDYVKSGYAAAKIKRSIPGYTVKLFFKDIGTLYLRINRALAAGDTSALRHLVTERILAQMKQELDVRHKGGWATVDWDMPKPSALQQRTMHGRLVAINPKDTSMAFAQMTVRLNSQQQFAAYDRKGKLVAGDPNQELVVEDYWVFERPLWIKDAQWRLCGRLTL